MTWRYRDDSSEIPVDFATKEAAIGCYERRIEEAARSLENSGGRLFEDGKLVAWFEVRRKL